MQKYWTIVLCALITMLANGAHDAFTINHNTKNIYHRFYLINRLQNTIELINQKRDLLEPLLCYKILSEQPWQSPKIKEMVDAMVEANTLQPLITAWQQLSSYRNLHDELFEKEFVQNVVLICQQIDLKDPLCAKRARSIAIDTDHIAQTFYTINRLKKPIAMLYRIYKQSKDLFNQESTKGGFLLEEFGHSSNGRINDCIHEIHETQSLKPIKRVYKECAQYRYAGDDTFLKEQLSLLFFAYKVMLTKKLSNQNEQTIMHEMDAIQYITQNLEEFSTDQILTAIDMMTDKLSTIHNLEKRSKTTITLNLYVTAVPIIAASAYFLYRYIIKR